MQMSLILSAQSLHPFQSPAFHLQSIYGTDSTKTHLSNLDKLLQKPTLLAAQQPIRKVIPRNGSSGGSSHNNNSNNKGRSFPRGLSLDRIWPEMKAAEEMSPRYLNRIQRLLSMSSSAEKSPRNDLGSRWEEYHGCDDWVGLLDPLDENLRRVIFVNHM